MYGLSAKKRQGWPLWRDCTMTYSYNNKKEFEKLVCMYSQSVHSWPQDLRLFGCILIKKKNCTKETRRNHEVFDIKWSSKPKKKTEVVPCHLETTISMSKNIFGFATKLRTALYSTWRSLRLWRGVTIVAWVLTSYIAGNTSTNLLAIHIYCHLYPQYIRHHFWRRRCMKRTLVCAFAVTRDKKNYNEKQAYRKQHQ